MAAARARSAVSRIGLPLILLALATLLSLAALGQPLFAVTEEDRRDGTVDVSKFLGGQVTKEKYQAGQLMEVEILPYDSPLFEEVAMAPVLQVAFFASLASTVLLVLGTVFLAMDRWSGRWLRYGLFFVMGAALAALAGTAYLSLALSDPIRLHIDPMAGFFPGGVGDLDGSLVWGPGVGWYLIVVGASLAVLALLFDVKEHGIARWRAAKA